MSGQQAWDALRRARLLPDTWMGSARLFDPVADSNLRISTAGEPEPAPMACPPTAAACVAIASCDPAAVESAERAALAMFDATDPWRLPTDKRPRSRPSQCVWELLPIGGAIGARKIHMVQGNAVFALEAAALAVEHHDRSAFDRVQASITQDDSRAAARVQAATGLRIADVTRIRWWDVARDLGLAVPDQLRRDHRLGMLPKELRGKRFADLPDFATAQTSIAAAGFATGLLADTCFMFAVRPAWASLERLASQ